MSTALDPKRMVAELKELRSLTSDANGAQRVAFTRTWVETRAWLKSKLEALPVEVHTDAAGNLWTTLRGQSEDALLIGGHMDSVPNGGWLDGCLNVLAGVEILRRIAEQHNGKPPVTVRLVDWADEEGARFGKSLFGSSACSGNLNMDEARELKDKQNIRLPDALKEVGVDFERVKESGKELKNAAAYLALANLKTPLFNASRASPGKRSTQFFYALKTRVYPQLGRDPRGVRLHGQPSRRKQNPGRI